MNLNQKSLYELKNLLQKKEIKASEIVEDCLRQIEKVDPTVNAFVSINESVREESKKWDKDYESKKDLPLAGLPIALKDMFCVEGVETTACSKMLKGFIPPYSSTVTHRLKQAGSIYLGKLNQDEFAMGSSNEVSYFGSCKNPWNTDYVPGGSSGGSAAAVAARMVPASMGTDTGGSVRQPASFCGVVGLKPTYGRVSRYGIVGFASSLDQAGPMTTSVKDAALMLEAISGFDVKDSTSSRESVPNWLKQINPLVKGKRIGVIKSHLDETVDSEVVNVVKNAIDILKSEGAEIIELDLPYSEYSVPIYYLITSSEASSNLARYDGVRYGYRADFEKEPAKDLADFYARNRGEGFGEEVKRRIMLGTYSLSSGYYDAYYNKASQVRRLIKESYLNAFSQCDVIVNPVTTTPAFKIGERVKDPVTMYKNDIFTTSTNLAGLPAMSLPGGFSSDKLPIGVQLTSTYFDEQTLFDVGQCLETNLNIKDMPDVVS